MLTFVELFAGIGGFSLGFERAGMECIGHCEISPYSQKVLKKHWPSIPLWDDITKLQPSDLGSPDIICGGFPCQDLSVAGKQKGIHGERSGLFNEIIRLCRDVRPKYIVLENVRQLSSKQDWFCQVLARLCEIGYDAEWEVISAAQFGASHKRERIWIVAYPNSFRLQEERTKQQTARTDQLCGQVPNSGSDSTWGLSERTKEEKPTPGKRCKDEGWPSSWETIWSVEPNVGRMAYGIPQRVDRLKCLGNALVPQIAEWIGHRIVSGQYPYS